MQSMVVGNVGPYPVLHTQLVHCKPPSHCSPASTFPFPQFTEKSEDLLRLNLETCAHNRGRVGRISRATDAVSATRSRVALLASIKLAVTLCVNNEIIVKYRKWLGKMWLWEKLVQSPIGKHSSYTEHRHHIVHQHQLRRFHTKLVHVSFFFQKCETTKFKKKKTYRYSPHWQET